MGRLRHSLILLGVLALWAGGAAPAALAAGGCGGPADSALNQYCETIPTARGGQLPRAGLPGLAATLAPRVLRQLEQTGGLHRRAALRKLLSLPSPDRRQPTSSRAEISADSSLPLWLIVVLAATALALLLAAANRWRKRGADG